MGLLPYMRETQPWPRDQTRQNQAPAPHQWQTWRSRHFSPGAPSPSRMGMWALGEPAVTHPVRCSAWGWNERWGLGCTPNALLSPSLHCRAGLHKGPKLCSLSALQFIWLGPGLWVASQTAKGGGASLKSPRLLWVWPTHPFKTGFGLAWEVKAGTTFQILACCPGATVVRTGVTVMLNQESWIHQDPLWQLSWQPWL
jgi:hypothetical protein